MVVGRYVYSHINGTFHTDRDVYFDHHPHALTLCLYSDEQWPKFQLALKKGSLCRDRQQLASWYEKVLPKYVHVEGSAPKHDFRFASTLQVSVPHPDTGS